MINTQKQTQTHGKPYFGQSYYIQIRRETIDDYLINGTMV